MVYMQDAYSLAMMHVQVTYVAVHPPSTTETCPVT